MWGKSVENSANAKGARIAKKEEKEGKNMIIFTYKMNGFSLIFLINLNAINEPN